VHDKQVRRRRAVLALLVAVSLILLTGYFGEADSGPLHSVQRGIVTIFSPIQKGASTVLAPVRDVAGFFSSTFHAKDRVAELQAEVQKLTGKVASLQGAEIQNNQLRQVIKLGNSIGIANYRPVAAHVIGSDPSLWYDQVYVDAGSDQGVATGQPVIGEGGLAGLITDVTADQSTVTLVNDHTIEIGAEVEDGVGNVGVLESEVGNPNQLVLSDLPTTANVQDQDLVVTAGFHYGKLDSYYPPDIPIGVVSNANEVTLASSGQVQVKPVVDLHTLDVVEILTKPHPGTTSAALIP
jgi:rod shape-determining protein MreC